MPLARKLDAENSSRGVAVTSAAGRKCSQAPREARPACERGLKPRSHSRKFTAE